MKLENGIRRAESRLDGLGKVLQGVNRVLIASHNNPDPDSIASALLLQNIIKRRFEVPAVLSYSGVIGRAENNALLSYAKRRFQALGDVKLSRFDSVALVDTQPGTGNHLFSGDDGVTIVFDHHRLRPQTVGIPFHDVHTRVGATTTLLYLYWRAAGFRLTKKYATIMLYALRSETQDMGREASPLDRDVYKALFAVADLGALSRIVNANVTREYFVAVHRAIEASRLYGSVLVTNLGKLPYPDVVAQIAEYFLKYEEASYVFATGVYRNSILMSLRADDPAAHLGIVAQQVVGEWGTAGGHGSAAGGQIVVPLRDTKKVNSVQQALIRRLLGALDVESERPKKLIRD